MRIICIRLSSVHYNHDTMSVIDNDGRSICLRRAEIKELKKLLSGRSKREYRDRDEVKEEEKRG